MRIRAHMLRVDLDHVGRDARAGRRRVTPAEIAVAGRVVGHEHVLRRERRGTGLQCLQFAFGRECAAVEVGQLDQLVDTEFRGVILQFAERQQRDFRLDVGQHRGDGDRLARMVVERSWRNTSASEIAERSLMFSMRRGGRRARIQVARLAWPNPP